MSMKGMTGIASEQCRVYEGDREPMDAVNNEKQRSRYEGSNESEDGQGETTARR